MVENTAKKTSKGKDRALSYVATEGGLTEIDEIREATNRKGSSNPITLLDSISQNSDALKKTSSAKEASEKENQRKVVNDKRRRSSNNVSGVRKVIEASRKFKVLPRKNKSPIKIFDGGKIVDLTEEEKQRAAEAYNKTLKNIWTSVFVARAIAILIIPVKARRKNKFEKIDNMKRKDGDSLRGVIAKINMKPTLGNI